MVPAVIDHDTASTVTPRDLAAPDTAGQADASKARPGRKAPAKQARTAAADGDQA